MGITDILTGGGPALIVGGGLCFMNTVRVVPEYKRGVIFRLGSLLGPMEVLRAKLIHFAHEVMPAFQ